MGSDQDNENTGGTSESGTRRRRLIGGLALALLASWLLMFAPLPYSLLSGLAGLLALVLLIPLIVSSFRAGRRGMALVTALIGIPATLLIMAGSLITLLFYGPMSDLEECRSTAITEQAQAQCQEDAQNSVASWISGLVGP